MLQASGTTTSEALVKDTTTQTFVKDVIEESKRQPVLVDFWAPWCGPCKQLTPVLEKAVKAAKGKVKLVKMNIDEHPSIAAQMGIQSIPAVIAFANGQPADGFMGALPEGQVVAFLERLTKERIGGEAKDLVDTADATLAAGDAAGQAKTVGPVGELEQKVAANPLDHQARFDLAVALNSKGRRQDALEHLLAIVKRDRKWNDDAARKQLVQFFDAWGPTDEATIDGRKQLSSILFA